MISVLVKGLVVPHPETLKPMPGVAESWTISDDFRQYKFKLRADARWSNGDPVTAEDFVFSLKRGLAKKLASSWTDMSFFIKNSRRYYDGDLDGSINTRYYYRHIENTYRFDTFVGGDIEFFSAEQTDDCIGDWYEGNADAVRKICDISMSKMMTLW